jgi:ribosome-associated heat shock protein Hsp15
MSGPVRVDKWLWAARFFKTRSMAREAILGGKIQLNDNRVKPGRQLAVGDRLRIRKGEQEFLISVLELSSRRGPAPVAQGLYAEDPDSIQRREAQAEERRLQRQARSQRVRRPDKKQRRQIIRFRQDRD